MKSSAGVFDSAGKLVRRIWEAVDDHPSLAAPTWDGRLDNGTVAPSGTYTIKTIAHNISYTWEGVIGNTSPNHLNNLEYHTYGTTMVDLAITPGSPGEIYWIHAYDERFVTCIVAKRSS